MLQLTARIHGVWLQGQDYTTEKGTCWRLNRQVLVGQVWPQTSSRFSRCSWRTGVSLRLQLSVVSARRPLTGSTVRGTRRLLPSVRGRNERRGGGCERFSSMWSRYSRWSGTPRKLAVGLRWGWGAPMQIGRWESISCRRMITLKLTSQHSRGWWWHLRYRGALSLQKCPSADQQGAGGVRCDGSWGRGRL